MLLCDHMEMTGKTKQAVILAAGKGTRMLHLTAQTPKPLLSLGNKNLLEHKILALPGHVREVVLVIGVMGDQIREFFGDAYAGRRIRYATQEIQNGTMGALLAAKHLLEERFLVMMGDDLYGAEDIARLSSEVLAMGVWPVENVIRGGEILSNDDGTLREVIETKREIKNGFLNPALYALNQEIFAIEPVSAANGHDELGLPQTLAMLAKRRPVKLIPIAHWTQITAPEDLVRAEEFVRG